MKRRSRIIYGLIALPLLLVIFYAVYRLGKTAVLTWLYGDELSQVVLTFQITTLELSGSKETYYMTERESFAQLATNEKLSALWSYWDSYFGNLKPGDYIVLNKNTRLENVCILEYNTQSASVAAVLSWYEIVLDPDQPVVVNSKDHTDIKIIYHLVVEDGTWKVSDTELPDAYWIGRKW